MGLFWLLILIAIVVVAWLLVRGPLGGTGNTERQGPLDILKERYARGEIRKEEYEQKRRDLQV